MLDGEVGGLRNPKELSSTEWAEWVIRFLAGLSTDPRLPPLREDDPRLLLIAFTQKMSFESRLRFAEGIALALEATPPRQENARLLYFALDLLSYFTPVSGKRVVRQLLFSSTLWDCVYRLPYSDADVNLQTVALSASSAYSVDESLIRFIRRSLSRASDHRYFLVAFRLISRFYEKAALDILLPAIDATEVQSEADKLMRELLRASRRYGYAELMAWYKDNYSLLQNSFQGRYFHMRVALRRLVPDWGMVKSSLDDYEKLLSLAVRAEEALVSAEEILAVAELGHNIDPQCVSFVLAILMGKRARRRVSYVDPQASLYSAMLRRPESERAIIQVGKDGPVTAIPPNVQRFFEMSDTFILGSRSLKEVAA